MTHSLLGGLASRLLALGLRGSDEGLKLRGLPVSFVSSRAESDGEEQQQRHTDQRRGDLEFGRVAACELRRRRWKRERKLRCVRLLLAYPRDGPLRACFSFGAALAKTGGDLPQRPCTPLNLSAHPLAS